MSKWARLASISLVLLAACRSDDRGKIEALQKRIEVLEARIGTGARPPQAQRPRRPEPDPKDVFAVSIDGLPTKGPADAPVTIVEGYEYACPACNFARQSVNQTLARYGDKVRVIYKPFVVHPEVATDASVAACAANHQGKFEAMDTLIWEKAFGGRDWSATKLQSLAGEAGLDLDRYAKDLDGCRQSIVKHQTELERFGQGATPTFFINGRYVVGGNPVKIQAVVDEELALAQERIRSGTRAADYYATWVIGKGLAKFEPKPQG